MQLGSAPALFSEAFLCSVIGFSRHNGTGACDTVPESRSGNANVGGEST